MSLIDSIKRIYIESYCARHGADSDKLIAPDANTLARRRLQAFCRAHDLDTRRFAGYAPDEGLRIAESVIAFRTAMLGL